MQQKLFCCGSPFQDIPHKRLDVSPTAWLDANEILASVLHAVGVPVITASTIDVIAYRAQFETVLDDMRRKISVYPHSVQAIFKASNCNNWNRYLQQFDARMTKDQLFEMFGYSSDSEFIDAHRLSYDWEDWLEQFIGFTSNCTWENDATWSTRMLRRSNPSSLTLEVKRQAMAEIKELTQLNSSALQPI
jgi:hypothetical protein